MRRAAIALAASALLALSGCTLSIYNSYRDIESLEVVQALRARGWGIISSATSKGCASSSMWWMCRDARGETLTRITSR